VSSDQHAANAEHDHQREFTRSEIQFAVEVATETAVAEGTLRDVGMRGVFVNCEHPFPAGVDCTITILLARGESGHGSKPRATRCERKSRAWPSSSIGSRSRASST
jgi:hypothetical protein